MDPAPKASVPKNFLLMSSGAEGLECADPGARTPIGASGNFTTFPGWVVGGWGN